MTTTNESKQKVTKMEFNKVSIVIISILVTLAISFGGFCYQNGATTNELKNIKEQQLLIKIDLEKDIDKVEKNSAKKDVVDMIFSKINSIESKLDTLIMNKDK